MATNVPYLERIIKATRLRESLWTAFPEAEADLATAFRTRAARLTPVDAGRSNAAELAVPRRLIEGFRRDLLEHVSLNLIARLGPGAFAGITGEVVKALPVLLGRGRHRAAKHCVTSSWSPKRPPTRPWHSRSAKTFALIVRENEAESGRANSFRRELPVRDFSSDYATADSRESKPVTTDGIGRYFWELPSD